MMIKKIKTLYAAILSISKMQRKLDELMWANIYRETIKDSPWLNTLSISPGDYAANFSLLYILARLLKENKVNTVLEFGLGQSTRFIESFSLNSTLLTCHDVVEDNVEWLHSFDKNRHSNYNIITPNKSTISKHNTTIQVYNNLNNLIKSKYDLYLIDGPLGLPKYSRYDICEIAATFDKNSEFIIIIDDYHREGEKQTVSELLKILKSINVNVYTRIFSGTKDQFVIVTEMHKSVSMY